MTPEQIEALRCAIADGTIVVPEIDEPPGATNGWPGRTAAEVSGTCPTTVRLNTAGPTAAYVAALEEIASSGRSQYASAADMIAGVREIARRALESHLG